MTALALSPKLAKAMQAFDEQALATLANPGLLRRAQRDLEGGKVVLEASEGDNARLAVDGQAVQIGPAGPVAGSCDCAAAGVCRHLLGAVLLLRGLSADDGAGEAVEEADAVESAPQDPQAIIAAIALEDARRFTGRPGWRAALELLAEAESVAAGDTSVAVRFAGLDEPVLILRGQGMDGIVSGASKAKKKAYHAAALLAARRHFGMADEGLEESADAPSAAAATSAPDPEFLARVERALVDCTQLGFNLAPVPLEESLFELSVSSRADAMPRLASLLRAIAAQMRLRRQRSFAFDADQMLELVGIAHALCRAVAHCDPGSPQFAALAGAVRRSYQPLGEIDLLGCGAEIWRTGSGARGATAYFLDEESGRFYSVSHARGAGQDPLFDPRAAYRDQAMWQAGALERLAHARIALTGAGAADDGRLSVGKDVRARIIESGVLPSPNSPHVHADWEGLRVALAQDFGLGLAATGLPQMALLHPADSARPSFDDLAQRLIWPLRDTEGRWLALTIDHDEHNGTALERLEEQLAKGWRGNLLAKVSTEGEGLSLSPVTLFGDGEPVNLTVPPTRFAVGKPRDMRSWLQRLRPDPGRNLQFVQPSASARAVSDAWRHVLDRLEAGPQLARLLDDKRAAHAARLTDYGMAHLGDVMGAAGEEENEGEDEGSTLLTAAYALLLARQQRRTLPYLA